MRRPFHQRLRQLEIAALMPRVQLVDHPPLSRDELAVAIILKVQQLAPKARISRERAAAVAADPLDPEYQRRRRAIEWAQTRGEEMAAVGQWDAMVARVRAKGYACT